MNEDQSVDGTRCVAGGRRAGPGAAHDSVGTALDGVRPGEGVPERQATDGTLARPLGYWVRGCRGKVLHVGR